MTNLLQAEVDGDTLADAEIAEVFVPLVVAGNDTTRRRTSHALKALTDHPGQRAWLAADFDGRIDSAVQEFVRWATPITTFRRTAVADVELGGQRILAGGKVVMRYASGNWGTEVFTDPHAFDLSRAPNPHLAFGGGGTHYCLGNQVAKAQLGRCTGSCWPAAGHPGRRTGTADEQLRPRRPSDALLLLTGHRGYACGGAAEYALCSAEQKGVPGPETAVRRSLKCVTGSSVRTSSVRRSRFEVGNDPARRRPAMTATPDQRLGWMHEGSRIFLGELEKVPEGDWAEPLGLPGWTVAHLVAHVAYNASALSRLVHWARTGEETLMYSGPEQRAEEIEHGATLPPSRLRALVRETDEQLWADLAGLSTWDAKVRTAQGRIVPAAEIPWLRTREVWIHAVDLGTGLRFEDFPADLLGALITDITDLRQNRDGGPGVVIHPEDRTDRWRIVDVLGGEPAVVRAPAAGLARWLAGRGRIEGGPDLGRWL